VCTQYEKDEGIKDEFPNIPEPFIDETPEGEKKIIIVKLDAVGDVLRTTSILPSLKEKYVDSTVTWITKENSYEVLKDNDMIDEIYFNTDELEHIYNDLFDIAINLDSGTESCSIMNEINAKDYFGYHIVNGKPYPVNTLANEWYLMGVNDNVKKQNKKTYHKIIHEICGLQYNNKQPTLGMSPEMFEMAKELAQTHNLNNYNEFILINLGGGNRWQYKKWTKEGYIELVNKLAEAKPGAAIGIIAGDEDKDFYAEISEKIEKKDSIIRFGCKNSMEDFICIISLADKIFTSDSLALHIATALGKYTVCVVGPTSHSELDVFGSGKIIYSDKVDCLCCYLNRCDKTVTCMNTLEAGDLAKTLLN
jgi:heptosyltransferase-2